MLSYLNTVQRSFRRFPDSSPYYRKLLFSRNRNTFLFELIILFNRLIGFVSTAVLYVVILLIYFILALSFVVSISDLRSKVDLLLLVVPQKQLILSFINQILGIVVLAIYILSLGPITCPCRQSADLNSSYSVITVIVFYIYCLVYRIILRIYYIFSKVSSKAYLSSQRLYLYLYIRNFFYLARYLLIIGLIV